MKKHELGGAFRELRLLTKLTYKDFAEIMGKNTLVKFEAGEQMLSFDKLWQALQLMGFTVDEFLHFAGILPVPPRFGAVFHKIRQQRGYSKAFFENLGLSPLRLQLFEEGRISLAYPLLDAALLAMKVQEADFGYALNDDQEDYFVRTVDAIDQAILLGDTAKLQEIEQDAHFYAKFQEDKLENPYDDEDFDYSDEELDFYANARVTRQYSDYRLLELTAKGGYLPLSEGELIEVSDFLSGISIWLEYGLGLLAINAWQLPFDLMQDILQGICRQKSRYIGKIQYRRRVVQAGGRCALTLMQQNRLTEAERILEQIQAFAFKLDTHVMAMYRFSRACLDYKKGKNSGMTDMLKVIEALDFLGVPESRDFCQRYLEVYVSREK